MWSADGNYALVDHLANGTKLSATDSTGNTTAGTISGPTATAGNIDGAGIWGAASTDKITTNLTAHSSTRTYEVWAYRTGTGDGALGRITDKHTVSAEVETFQVGGTLNDQYAYGRTFSGGTADWEVALPSANAWHHIVVTYNSSAATNDPIFYIDGAVATLTADTNTTGTANTNTDPYVIGNRGSDNARNWAGNLDEFRVSNAIRTAGWISTEYKNQSAPSTFYTVGSEVTF